MNACIYCGRSGDEVRLIKGHTIPRFLDKSRSNRGTFKICFECELERSSKEYAIAQSFLISENKEFYQTFLKSTFEIESLAEAKLIDRTLQGSLDRLLYANVISTIETYLSDAFINIVMSDSILIKCVVETNPEFKKQKFDLSEIYSKYDSIESIVREYLANLIYHNLSKVKNLYHSVLGVDFPDKISEIYKAISIRHDIVHRNGKAKNGNQVIIKKTDVLKLLEQARKFVEHINQQLPKLH